MIELTGFSMSANLVVNIHDLDKMADFLMRAVTDNQMIYRIYSDTLEELGKI